MVFMVIGLMIDHLFFPTCLVQWRPEVNFVLLETPPHLYKDFVNMVIGVGDGFIKFIILLFFYCELLQIYGKRQVHLSVCEPSETLFGISVGLTLVRFLNLKLDLKYV
jgi:hypothetical protein